MFTDPGAASDSVCALPAQSTVQELGDRRLEDYQLVVLAGGLEKTQH
jgi:hypothetical protein